MQTQTTYIDNGQGWELELTRFRGASRSPHPPVLMIPGYAMNAFILSFHPSSRSMIEYLVSRDFEVWTANLRGQGDARRRGRPARFGMAEQALVDIPVAIDHVRRVTGRDELLGVGCSLGASLLYGYLAHHRDTHPLCGLISIGGPLRWDAVHPAMRVAFRSSRVAGAVRISGTRRFARAALPFAKRVPSLLSIYMNAGSIDLSRADQLVNTTDDPVPHINRQIALWLRQRDLVMRGVNVSEALTGMDLPVLCVLANRDGIVPPAAALSVQKVMTQVDVLEVGTPEDWYAHADLFINRGAEGAVFAPMAEWLGERC